MIATGLPIVTGLLLGGAMVIAGEAVARARVHAALALVEPAQPGHQTVGLAAAGPGLSRALRRFGQKVGPRRTIALAVAASLPAGLVASRLAGPAGAVVAVIAGALVPAAWSRRRSRAGSAKLETQLAEAVETCALAVRAGLSITQSAGFAAQEAEEPLRPLLARISEEQRLGTPFQEALEHFGEALDSDDARLFVLVVTTHARSGGNLSGALDEVAATIRHRIEVRRELRALSAQARVSGAILGSLPIAFFVVLAGTSQRELGPVYRSPAGIAMVIAGLVLEAIAYTWIRKLIRVEV